MRILTIVFLSALLIGGGILMSTHQPFGSALPAMGPLLSPFTGFWQQAESVRAELEETTLSHPSLSDEVNVFFDDRMVPHIFAQNTPDAAFAQGYLTARHRLWQMDIAIRATVGRLSEVVGEKALNRDLEQRRKGMHFYSKKILEDWKKSPDDWKIIQAYSKGINAYVESLSPADYPVEFKLLGYAPEPWSPLNTAIFYRSMAQTLCYKHFDFSATNTLAWLGREQFDFLFPEWNPKQSPIVPVPEDWGFTPEDTTRQPPPAMIGRSPVPFRSHPQPDPYLGSNNWAVAGSKTASGNPILCNDPHLRLSLPSIWYELQIHTPAYNAYGVSFPGVPIIIIGFNERIAWGVTNVGQDVLDWYEIQWTDEQRTHYVLDGVKVPVEQIVETIEIQGRTIPVLDTVRYTQWGPVVHQDSIAPHKGLAMRWAAYDTNKNPNGTVINTFHGLMQAKNYQDYYDALKKYDSPGQNIIYADQSGDIALTVCGQFPVKRQQQGRFVQDGSQSANAWQGTIPYAHLPRMRNPDRGFVASANQHSTDPSYPYYFLGNFDDYRGRLINQRLDSLSGATIEDMMALQMEKRTLEAVEGAPILLGLLDSTDTALTSRDELRALRQWDGRFEAKSRSATLFQQWFEEAYRLTFDEFFAREQIEETLMPENWRFWELLEQYPQHEIFDLDSTGFREDARQIVSMALESVLSSPIEEWGDYQTGHLKHLGQIMAFSIPIGHAGGHRHAPNAFNGYSGPSWRMIVELGETTQGYGVYPGGQSGNPGSPYYDNMAESWIKGEYYTLSHFRDISAAKDKAVSIFTFQPSIE